MTKHITELQIKAYWGISDLSLQELGTINIWVGDNNSGKTRVREALKGFDLGIISIHADRTNNSYSGRVAYKILYIV